MNTLYKFYLLILVVAMISCKTEKESNTAEVVDKESAEISISQKQFDSSEMAIGQLQMKQFDKTITVNGKVEIPNNSKAVVSSIMSGTIGALNLIEGQWIKKGQTLFTVTSPELIDLQEEYLVLQSKMEYLREEQNRKQKLVNENLSPRQDLLLAQSEYQTNQARYKTIGHKLKMYGVNIDRLSVEQLSTSLSVRSPISGYISHINALRGQYIDQTTEVVMVDNKSNIHLDLKVLERDGSLISTGQEIAFGVSGASSRKYLATVHLVSPSVSEEGMVAVYCKISNPKGLLPGMYASADIILESYNSEALPEDAIVQLEGKDHVLVESSKDNMEINYLPRYVELGSQGDGYVEIKNGSDFKDKNVLIKGGYYLVN